jgi:nickel/cobalt exporter
MTPGLSVLLITAASIGFFHTLFGPCEPLIPILMYPAAQDSIFGLILVTAVFGSATILTMLGVVLSATMGISFLPMARLERYNHALAGATIFLCGIAIQFLGP